MKWSAHWQHVLIHPPHIATLDRKVKLIRFPCLLWRKPDRSFCWQGKVNLLVSPKPVSWRGAFCICCSQSYNKAQSWLLKQKKIEAFVCQLYEPGTNLVDVGELRWRLFTKKTQLHYSRIREAATYTQGLHQAIARAHYQAMVRDHDHIHNTPISPANDYRWEADGDHLVPVTTRDPPAPGTITPADKTCLQEIPMHVTLFLSTTTFELFWDVHMCGADEEVSKALLGIDDDDDEDGDPLMYFKTLCK